MIKDALFSPEMDWKPMTVKRGEFLSRSGEIERNFYYVESGALRAYNIIEEREFTVRFGYTGSIFTSLSSFFSGKTGNLFIEAMRESKVLKCNKEQFEAYINKDLGRLREYKSLLEQLVIDCIEREYDLMLQDPRSRLDRLIKRSPQLFQEVPHKYIAAYLRMSPETLSRLLKS